jgi:hypothetical protein
MTGLVAHPTLPLVAINVIGLDGVSGVWSYDVEADRFEAWAVSSSGHTLAEPEVIHYPTFDTEGEGARLTRGTSTTLHTQNSGHSRAQPVRNFVCGA